MTYVKYLSIKLLKEEDCLFLDYIYIVTLVKHSSRDWTHTVFYLVFVYWFNALFIKSKCIRSGVSQSGFAFAHRNINPSERGSGSRVVSRCDGEVAILVNGSAGQRPCRTDGHRGSRTALVVMLIRDLWGGFALSFFSPPAQGFQSYLHITLSESCRFKF